MQVEEVPDCSTHSMQGALRSSVLPFNDIHCVQLNSVGGSAAELSISLNLMDSI